MTSFVENLAVEMTSNHDYHTCTFVGYTRVNIGVYQSSKKNSKHRWDDAHPHRRAKVIMGDRKIDVGRAKNFGVYFKNGAKIRNT